jgi:hypothetical protein
MNDWGEEVTESESGNATHWTRAEIGEIIRLRIVERKDRPTATLSEEESNEVMDAYESGDRKRIDAVWAKYWPETPWDFRAAKGILSLSEPPEDIIRRARRPREQKGSPEGLPSAPPKATPSEESD